MVCSSTVLPSRSAGDSPANADAPDESYLMTLQTRCASISMLIVVLKQRVAPLWELVRTAHLATLAFSDVFAELGITAAQYGVLASLADGDDLSQADLARAVLVTPQSMGRLVAAMVQQGLVTRDGPGGHGRRTGLALTERGGQVFARARPAAYALNDPQRLGLDDEGLTVLVSQLKVLRDRLSNGQDAG